MESLRRKLADEDDREGLRRLPRTCDREKQISVSEKPGAEAARRISAREIADWLTSGFSHPSCSKAGSLSGEGSGLYFEVGET